LPFPLLDDRGNQLRQAFGVPNSLFVVPGRVTYLIDGSGVIRHLFNNLLDGAAHGADALKALQQLTGS
jgi:peroxiredoxin Q/BCP